jgi:hypothetical protein
MVATLPLATVPSEFPVSLAVAIFGVPVEPLVAVVSTAVVSALAVPVEPLVATVSLSTAVAAAPEAPLCAFVSPTLVVLPVASPLVSFPLSWPVSSVALLPGEKVITSVAALRLLIAAGSAELVLGIAGSGFVGALVETMTMRGVLAWW